MDFPQLALKMALLAGREAEPAPSIDLSPVVDQLEQIKLALGVMQKMPRPVAA